MSDYNETDDAMDQGDGHTLVDSNADFSVNVCECGKTFDAEGWEAHMTDTTRNDTAAPTSDVTTWADGFGNWHAAIGANPATSIPQLRQQARTAICRKLGERGVDVASYPLVLLMVSNTIHINGTVRVIEFKEV